VDAKYLGFSWNLTAFEVDHLKLQLKFENPIYISSQGVDRLDKLKVTIKRPEFFLSYNFRVPELDSFVSGKIPQQFADEATAAALADAADAASGGAKAFMAGSMAFNLLFSFALQQIWDTLNSLQVIGYMSYFNVYTPNHVSVFYSVVLDLAELDFVDLTPQAQAIFPFLKTEDQEEGEAGDESEAESRRLAYTVGSSDEADEDNRADILQALATLMIFALAVPAVIIIVLLIYWGRKLHSSIQKSFRKIKHAFFWNGPLRYWIESYISISLAYVSWFSLPRKWDTSADYWINIFCLFHLFVYLISPILITRFLRRNFDRFGDPRFRSLYGELTLKLNPHQFSSTNLYAIFCYRRLLLTVFIVFLAKTPAL
jgi:hypothetical protein